MVMIKKMMRQKMMRMVLKINMMRMRRKRMMRMVILLFIMSMTVIRVNASNDQR